MSKLTDAVLALAGPVAAQQGCEIWDVEYVKEAGSRYLRVYIDKPDGVSIQDCEDFSRALDPILDEKDPVTLNFWHVYGEQSGSPMDVLVQEFNREANTIGSKCNDIRITERVLVLKNEIEKIREQVQNVE